MNRNKKITVLSFDETYVSHKICYDKQTQQIIGPHKSVQIVMARGLYFIILHINNVLCNTIVLIFLKGF